MVQFQQGQALAELIKVKIGPAARADDGAAARCHSARVRSNEMPLA